MIFKKKTRTARQYQTKRAWQRALFIVGCLLACILGFFAAGPVLSWLGL